MGHLDRGFGQEVSAGDNVHVRFALAVHDEEAPPFVREVYARHRPSVRAEDPAVVVPDRLRFRFRDVPRLHDDDTAPDGALVREPRRTGEAGERVNVVARRVYGREFGRGGALHVRGIRFREPLDGLVEAFVGHDPHSPEPRRRRRDEESHQTQSEDPLQLSRSLREERFAAASRGFVPRTSRRTEPRTIRAGSAPPLYGSRALSKHSRDDSYDYLMGGSSLVHIRVTQ